MVIKTVRARNIRIPLPRPLNNPAFQFTYCEYVIVNIETDTGIEGWSFVFGMPYAKAIVEDLAEILVGESIDIRRLWHKMMASRVVRWDRGGIALRAVSAIDIALWDIMGKKAGMPIHQMLGTYRTQAPVYYSGGHYPVSWSSTSDLMKWIEDDFSKGIARGFKAFKMKIGGRVSVALDLERISFARELIGSDCKLMLDAFCAYDVETIIPMAKKFERYDIAYLEEPITLDDIPGCAYVAQNVSMPIALGESHYTIQQFRDIINSNAARIIQPDITYVGGITAFIQYASVAAFKGIKIAPHWCHDLSIQMACVFPDVIEMEYCDKNSALFLIQKVIANPVMATDGMITVPNGNGHGLVLDEEAVAKYLVK